MTILYMIFGKLIINLLLFKEFVDHKRVEKMNPTKMLNELSDMLRLQYNMSFLEWIFDKCGKPKLVKNVQQYSAENQFQLECFNTNFPQSKSNVLFTRGVQ